MIYSKLITTPKNTLIVSPLSTDLFLSKGLVYKMEIQYPSGSAGLMGVAILDGSYQVWPSTGLEWFTGNGGLISFDDIYLKESAPFKFTIKTYNLDDTYNHSVQVRIGFVTSDIFMARFLPSVSYQFFSEMLSKLAAEQASLAEEQRQAILKSPFTFATP